MNPKNTWLMVMVAAGLFAFIWFIERQIKPPVMVIERTASGIDTNLVSVIAISPRDSAAIRVERTNGVWKMTEPGVYDVEAYSVNRFLSTLGQLVPHRRITAAELQSHKNVEQDFGFDSPRYTILIRQGEDNYQLKLGNRTAPGDEVFVQVVGSDFVDIIGADFLKYFPVFADDWRDRTFAQYDIRNVNQLTVSNAGGIALKFQRDTNRVWYMTDPLHSPAADNLINILLAQTRNARVTHFVSTNQPADLAAWGLQPPVVKVDLAGGTNPVASLQFGKTNEDNDLYARAGPQAPVVMIPRGQIELWHAGADGFRDRNLVSQDLNSLQQGFNIDVTGAKGETIFTVHWQINRPPWVTDKNGQDYPADHDAILGFFSKLRKLQIAQPYTNQSFAVQDIAHADDLVRYGLAESNLVRRYQLSVAPVGGPVTLLVQLDFGFPNTNFDGTMYVRRGGPVQDDAVYAARIEDFNNLPARALDFRPRQVWPVFLAEDISRLMVSWQGRSLTLDHRGPNAWTNANDPQSISDAQTEMGTESVVESLLGSLQAMKWVGRVDKDPPDLGFADLSLHIELSFKGGETRRIDFGGPAPAPGGRYAAVTLDGQRWVFILSPTDWSELTQHLWLPQKPAETKKQGVGNGG